MARFLLCHEFGGVYLDADTLFLRDWEELWNWKGAFAYRWSWHDDYNTAALKMSDLGMILAIAGMSFGLHEGRRRYERRKRAEEEGWVGVAEMA